VGEELGTPRGGGPMSSVLPVPEASPGRGLRRREMQRKKMGNFFFFGWKKMGNWGRGRDSVTCLEQKEKKNVRATVALALGLRPSS